MSKARRVEPLDAALHRIADFSCGQPALDRWLRAYAGQSQRRDVARKHLDPPSSTIAQEGLTNARKHAPGVAVTLTVHPPDGRLEVEVRSLAPVAVAARSSLPGA